MYTLYYLPGTCSLAVHVALNEVGADFKTVSVSVADGQPRPADFLKINPRGNVPVLAHDGFTQREGAAILTTLLDEHRSPLLPASGEARATALEWLMFANASLHPAYARCFFQHKALGDKAGENPLYAPAIEHIQKLWNDVETQLSSHEYLCGTECSIADILITVIANWSPNLKKPITFGPKTKALFNRVIARPAYQKAMEAESVTYKVAA
ncbi:MAG: glutathione S-transferase family protein [Rickettsiales bacterium]|nr:glutathione S-transferase family protein [Rickettsiales bacterium]